LGFGIFVFHFWTFNLLNTVAAEPKIIIKYFKTIYQCFWPW